MTKLRQVVAFVDAAAYDVTNINKSGGEIIKFGDPLYEHNEI